MGWSQVWSSGAIKEIRFNCSGGETSAPPLDLGCRFCGMVVAILFVSQNLLPAEVGKPGRTSWYLTSKDTSTKTHRIRATLTEAET